MKKQSQNASLEAIKKAVLKGTALGITGLSLLATFTACNKTGQNTPSNNPNPKPPVVDPIDPTPIEDTVSIDKIYNDYFAGTSFDADIQDAQNALANRVFDNLTPQISRITYNESTKELTFEIAYKESNQDKSGSMTFVAPVIFQNIRGKQAKAIILEYAELVAGSEVSENKINETKSQIQSAIDSISAQIATSFANIKTTDITVEKEQAPTPVETISFDELIADELGEYLGNQQILFNSVKACFPLAILGFQSVDDDFKVAIEEGNLKIYTNVNTSKEKQLMCSTYKGTANEFEDLINISTNPQALLNAYFTNSQQNNMQIELNSEEYRAILSICQTIISNISEQSEQIEGLKSNNFTRTALARHNNELNQEDALQFALKLGYTEDEVLDVYVGTSPNGNVFDTEKYFDTGYMNWFIVSVLTHKNGQYQLEGRTIYVPHYSDSAQADYYRYFLEGEQGKRFVIQNQTSVALNGIIVDFADSAATTQNLYAKYASTNDLDLYLPLNLYLDILPR